LSAAGWRCAAAAQIGIDSLQDALPPRAARALRALLAAGMLLLFVALAWYGVDYALRTRFQISAALGISMFWVYSGMPIGCALLAAHLLLIVRGYVRGREFVADDGVDHDAAAAL
jgi:TRAP-type C4-dicarboxylate transport system permease small subunit